MIHNDVSKGHLVNDIEMNLLLFRINHRHFCNVLFFSLNLNFIALKPNYFTIQIPNYLIILDYPR